MLFGLGSSLLAILFALPLVTPPDASVAEIKAGVIECWETPGCKVRGECSADSRGRCVVSVNRDCSHSEICLTEGRCVAWDGKCVVGMEDFVRTLGFHGGRSYKDGECVATSAKLCRHSADCRYNGACTLRNGECIATSMRDCRKSIQCIDEGLCTLRNGECRALSDQDCRKRSIVCANEARCTAHDGGCHVGPDDCRKSDNHCHWQGACTTIDGHCTATSDADCRRSVRCHQHKLCVAKDGVCVVQEQAKARNMDAASEIQTMQNNQDSGRFRLENGILIDAYTLEKMKVALLAYLDSPDFPARLIEFREAMRTELKTSSVWVQGSEGGVGGWKLTFDGARIALVRHPPPRPGIMISYHAIMDVSHSYWRVVELQQEKELGSE